MLGRRTVVGFTCALVWWLAAWSPAAAQNEATGRKLALLVGVKTYDHELLKDLEYPENDVEDLAAVLKAQNFETVVLTTARGKRDAKEKPTAENIRARLKALLVGANKRDLMVVALAGHGIQPLGSDDSYFCPADANPVIKNEKPIAPERLVSVGDILSAMTDSGIGEKLLMVDACRNDPSARAAKRRGVDHVNMSALPSRTGVLLSCSEGESSFEDKSLGRGHGVFFYHVIEGLKGAAKDPEGRITWDELALYVRSQVPPSVEKLYGKDGGEQSPNAIGNLRGVPTVLARIVAPPEPKSPPVTVMPRRAPPTPSSKPSEPAFKPAEPVSSPAGPFAGTQVGQTRKDNGLDIPLVWIPPGEFVMGSPLDQTDRALHENQVTVKLTKGFWLGQHEVTQSEWQRVMQTAPWTGNMPKEGDLYPATCMTWDDAMKFCEKLTAQEQTAGRLPADWQYTLPTEAQWEYACRGGSKTRFSFGDDDSDLPDYGWYSYNADETGERSAHLVGRKKPNPFGLYDMHGNVWEWCADRYTRQLAGGTDPTGPDSGAENHPRVYRGGSWDDAAKFCRSASRSSGDPADRSGNTLGFRVAAESK